MRKKKTYNIPDTVKRRHDPDKQLLRFISFSPFPGAIDKILTTTHLNASP